MQPYTYPMPDGYYMPDGSDTSPVAMQAGFSAHVQAVPFVPTPQYDALYNAHGAGPLAESQGAPQFPYPLDPSYAHFRPAGASFSPSYAQFSKQAQFPEGMYGLPETPHSEFQSTSPGIPPPPSTSYSSSHSNAPPPPRGPHRSAKAPRTGNCWADSGLDKNDQLDPTLPLWTDQGEKPAHMAVILKYRTIRCNREDGCPNRERCWAWHPGDEFRRPPVDLQGRVRYWPIMCARQLKGHCQSDPERASKCRFAHSEAEVRYHPAIYKTTISKAPPEPPLLPGATKPPSSFNCEAVDTDDVRPANLMLKYAPPRWVPTFRKSLQSAKATSAPATEWSVPKVPTVRRHGKMLFCPHYPQNVKDGACADADCVHAHSRDEVQATLFDEAEEKWEFAGIQEWEDFLIYKYKTLPCPYLAGHDWAICPYAHNETDSRRSLNFYHYTSAQCPNYSAARGCPRGDRCDKAHGPKEQLYHSALFKTKACRIPNACQRLVLCAYYHTKEDRRIRTHGYRNYGAPRGRGYEAEASGIAAPPPPPEKSYSAFTNGR